MDAQQQADLKAYADRLELLCLAQRDEITKLRAEVARLTEGANAHEILQSIYRDRDLPESLRAKAAIGALPVEKPRLLSMVPSTVDRRERWRAYERFVLKKQIIVETKALPARGSAWDAKFGDAYEPPPGDTEPPMDLYGNDAIKAHVEISELWRSVRRAAIGNGNGNGNEHRLSLRHIERICRDQRMFRDFWKKRTLQSTVKTLLKTDGLSAVNTLLETYGLELRPRAHDTE